MKKCYRIFYIILSLILLFNSLLLLVPNEPVKADGEIDKAAMVTILNTIRDDQGSWSQEQKDAQAECCLLFIAGARASGWTDEAITGACVNIMYESRFDPLAFEWWSYGNTDTYYFKQYLAWKAGTSSSYSTTRTSGPSGSFGGCGLCQWTYGRHTSFSNFSKSCGSYYTTNQPWLASRGASWTQDPTYLASAGKQVGFILTDTSWNSHESELGLPKINGMSDYVKLTDAVNATKYWCACYETPNNYVSTASSRSSIANQFYSLISGKQIGGDIDPENPNPNPGINPEDGEDLADYMMSHGWSEKELSSFCVMSENAELYSRLTGSSLEKLSQEDVSQIVYWEQGSDDINDKGGLTYVLRTIIMAFGIALVIWAMLFYTAYWVDTLNNIFDFSFVNLLSFGRLVISPDPDDSTYGKNKEKGSKSTVNHFDVIRICLVAVGFGVLILTGVLYKLIFWLIITVTNLLKRIF